MKKIRKVHKAGIYITAAVVMSFITATGSCFAINGISGKVSDQELNKAIPFANIALWDTLGNKMVAGTSAGFDGDFVLVSTSTGKYRLLVSAVGYLTYEGIYELDGHGIKEVGLINLRPTQYQLEEFILTAERVKAVHENGKTVYTVNRNIADASLSTTDIMRLLPGVDVGFNHELSIDGNRNIMIMVDGVERDLQYLQQLNSSTIDRVEVVRTPSSVFDSSVAGVLNLILAENDYRGVDGHIYAEIPVSASEIYSFPSGSFHYGNNKLNLFASYSGEFSYFDIIDSQSRKVLKNDSPVFETTTYQYIKQENWSHRFHYGFDYYISDKRQLRFYSYYNPYSREHSGNVHMDIGNGEEKSQWSAVKSDKDINHQSHYSVYYKQLLNESEDHAFSADIYFRRLNAQNRINYFQDNENDVTSNLLMPQQHTSGLKADYTLPVTDNTSIGSGFQARWRFMNDRGNTGFSYQDIMSAVYLLAGVSVGNADMQFGVRYERSSSGNINMSNLLPSLSANLKLKNGSSVQLAFRQAVSYPHIYHLNSVLSVNDPYSISKGSEDLKASVNTTGSIDYSLGSGDNFFSAGLFFTGNKNAINHLVRIQPDNIFISSPENMGNIYQYGTRVSGTLSIAKGFGLNAQLRIFEVITEPNEGARQLGLAGRRGIAADTGISLYASLKHGFSASVMMQYTTSVIEIQADHFTDALYILSVNKRFDRGFTIGAMSAMPLAGSFNYQGSEIDMPGLYLRSQGDIQMSVVPVWLTLKYGFSTGKRRSDNQVPYLDTEQLPAKGF